MRPAAAKLARLLINARARLAAASRLVLAVKMNALNRKTLIAAAMLYPLVNALLNDINSLLAQLSPDDPYMIPGLYAIPASMALAMIYSSGSPAFSPLVALALVMPEVSLYGPQSPVYYLLVIILMLLPGAAPSFPGRPGAGFKNYLLSLAAVIIVPLSAAFLLVESLYMLIRGLRGFGSGDINLLFSLGLGTKAGLFLFLILALMASLRLAGGLAIALSEYLYSSKPYARLLVREYMRLEASNLIYRPQCGAPCEAASLLIAIYVSQLISAYLGGPALSRQSLLLQAVVSLAAWAASRRLLALAFNDGLLLTRRRAVALALLLISTFSIFASMAMYTGSSARGLLLASLGLESGGYVDPLAYLGSVEASLRVVEGLEALVSIAPIAVELFWGG